MTNWHKICCYLMRHGLCTVHARDVFGLELKYIFGYLRMELDLNYQNSGLEFGITEFAFEEVFYSSCYLNAILFGLVSTFNSRLSWSGNGTFCDVQLSCYEHRD